MIHRTVKSKCFPFTVVPCDCGEANWSRSSRMKTVVEDGQVGNSTIDGSKTRIIGGYETDPNLFPWMAYIKGTAACGGSLIDNQHVVTAAHCVQNDFGIADVKVYLGAHDINNLPTPIKVSKVIIHPDYLEYGKKNGFGNAVWHAPDIAILILSTLMTKFGPFV